MQPGNAHQLKKVWVYGGGGFARELEIYLQNHEVEVVGRITRGNFTADKRGGSELYFANPHPVLIGVFNHRDDPVEVIDFLEGLGITDFVSPASIVNGFHDPNFSKYFLSSEISVTPHLGEDLHYIKENLFDDESRSVLDGFISYQTTGDIRKNKRSSDANQQYLGKTLPMGFRAQWMDSELKMMDIGAFDGDTLRSIYGEGRNLALDSFVCVEPDRFNFQKLSTCVKEMGVHAELLNVAIGAEAGEIEFVHEGLLSAREKYPALKEKNIALVPVLTIDLICKNFIPTHIKMDIEGAEMSALVGARETLLSHRPRLAISLYHLPYDVIRIPIHLMSLLHNYAWFIRCYGAHGYDTILYGLPLE